MSILLCAMTTWAQASLHVSETLPGTLTGNQYSWTSEPITMPEGHNKLRVTFLENTNKSWLAGFPMVCIAEFYLYDKNRNQVELTADRFSSNATHSGEGKMEAICNGFITKQEGESATDWYWHSQWSGTPNPYGYHYLEVNLAGIEADLSNYSIGWVTRIPNASPTEVVISTGTSSDDAGKNANVHMLPKVSTENNIILYTIKSARSGNFLAFTYNNEQPVQQSNKSYWYFTAGTDGKYVVHNIATDQVLNQNLNMQADGEWCILPAQYRSGMVFAKDANKLGETGNCIDEQNSGKTIGYWKHVANDNQGTTWIITETRDVDFAIFELQNKVIKSIGAPAREIESGKWYILNNAGRGNYVSQEVTNWKMRATSTIAKGQKAEAKAGYLFKITNEGDGEYNIMSGNGKYFKLGDNTASTSESPVRFEIAKIGNSEDIFYLFDKENNRAADGQETNNAFVGWATTPPTNAGGNDSYKLLPVEFEAGVEYIYDYYLNGAKIASETLVTEEFAGLEKYYGVSSNNIPTGAAAKGTYKVNITDNLPFEYSNSQENATNWYFVKMHSNEPGYIHDDENNHLPFYGGAGGTVVAEDDTRYRFAWAFVGDPINGFKVVNNVTRQAITSNGEGDATTTEVENATKWLAKASDVKKDDARYFTLKYPTNNQYLNANNNAGVKKLSHWGEADAGSTIILEDVADEYNYAITDEAENVYSGEFTYRGNGYMTFNGAYGHTLSNEVFNIAERKYTANIKFLYPVSKVGGATNETLLKLKDNNRYIRLNENDVYVSNEAVDASCYWAIYPAYSNGGFTFTIKNVSTGKYLHSDAEDINHEKGTVALSETPTQFTYVNRFNNNNDYSSFKIANKNLVLSINSPGTNAYLGLWNYTHGGAGYVSAPITEYKVNITDAQYATFYAPVAVTVPEGVTAHTVTITGDYAVLSEALTDIPAYTGVVLYSNTPDTYTFNVTNKEVAAIENNALAGTVTTTYVTGNAHVLGIKDGKVGFYTATTAGQEEGTFLNNHHKAYLPMSPEAQNSAGFRFEFSGTTAVEDVEIENENVKAIYDLTGRKLESIAGPGIYIIDGKKIIIR